MSEQCEAKRIQKNSAQGVVDQATTAYKKANIDYVSCLAPKDRENAAVAAIQSDIDRVLNEVGPIDYMNGFILAQLKREASADKTLGTLTDIATQENNKLLVEIEETKTAIRTERRKFLDSEPSVTTAVGGMYFTGQPDNQVLIAFLSCFGAFLLFAGVLVILNHVPLLYFQAMSQNDRLKFVVSTWVLVLVITYVGFYTFT